MKDLWLTKKFCENRRLTRKFMRIYRKKDSFLEPYLRKDVSTLAIIYVRFREKCKLGQDLKWNLFISSIIRCTTFSDEKNFGEGVKCIETYTDNFLKHFIRQSKRSSKVGAVNQFLIHFKDRLLPIVLNETSKW